MCDKDKFERFFVLLMASTVLFMVFCTSGCGGGGKSCETPKCGKVSDGNGTIVGLSVPGCGGLLSSGSGCGFDTCGLWSQSIKFGAGYVEKGKDGIFVAGIDDQYYVKDGCAGCSSNAQQAIYGAVVIDSPTEWSVSVGKVPTGEIYLGCGTGCGACNGDAPGREALSMVEKLTGIQ